MSNVGDHNYYYYTRDENRFLLTFGDCENRNCRRFINNLNQSNIDSLFDAIYTTVWLENRYGVRDKTYDTYLLGQSSTQSFITAVATNTTFFGLVPFDLICVADIAFYPYSCGDTRWNVEIDFGSISEFHYNFDPNDVASNSMQH